MSSGDGALGFLSRETVKAGSGNRIPTHVLLLPDMRDIEGERLLTWLPLNAPNKHIRELLKVLITLNSSGGIC